MGSGWMMSPGGPWNTEVKLKDIIAVGTYLCTACTAFFNPRVDMSPWSTLGLHPIIFTNDCLVKDVKNSEFFFFTWYKSRKMSYLRSCNQQMFLLKNYWNHLSIIRFSDNWLIDLLFQLYSVQCYLIIRLQWMHLLEHSQSIKCVTIMVG